MNERIEEFLALVDQRITDYENVVGHNIQLQLRNATLEARIREVTDVRWAQQQLDDRIMDLQQQLDSQVRNANYWRSRHEGLERDVRIALMVDEGDDDLD